MFIDMYSAGQPATVDGSYVLNGNGYGIGSELAQVYWDPGMLRPWRGDDGYDYVTINSGKRVFDEKLKRFRPKVHNVRIKDMKRRGFDHPTWNAMTLRKEAWIQMTDRIVRANRQRLRAWSDLAAANPISGFNAMGKMTYEYQAMSDPGEAVADMDVLADGRRDRPLFNLKSVPLPIVHADFDFSERFLANARNSGTPIDAAMGEACGRRIGEMVEKTVIGVTGGFSGLTYGTRTGDVAVAHEGTSTVYGYTTFPQRVTKTDLHTPVTTAPQEIVEDILEMRETMYSNGFFGPFMLYHSTSYDRFLDDDYFRSGGTAVTRTWRERVESIEGIAGIRRLDFLTSGYQLILIQMTSEVAEAILGMDVTTVRWDSKGGMQHNFKVMAINVPLLKSPYNGVAGIIHGTTS